MVSKLIGSVSQIWDENINFNNQFSRSKVDVSCSLWSQNLIYFKRKIKKFQDNGVNPLLFNFRIFTIIKWNFYVNVTKKIVLEYNLIKKIILYELPS